MAADATRSPEAGSRLLVDGMNVIGSRPDGWWHDRDAAVRRLAARLRRLAETTPTEVTLVLDGPELADVPEGRHGHVQIRYARRPGRDAADDRIVELLDEAGPGLTVVTADRELRARAAARGATLLGPTQLLLRLDSLDDRSHRHPGA